MSAYVVDPSVINIIVSAMENAIYQEGKYPSKYPDMRYLKSDLLREAVESNPAELGRTMYAMNINAVEQRYPGDKNIPGTYDENDNFVPFTYKRVGWDMINKYQAYKSLQCLLYQCNEGNVNELPLFKALEEFKSAMAEHFVEHSEEYEKAKW